MKPFRALPLRILQSISNRWAVKGIPKSPLPHLLKSNAAPSDSEIVTIRALISEVEVRIEELHHNNSHGSRATESRLLKFIQVHKAILSPVRYLPSEVLQEIFHHYSDHGFINLPISMVPWRLGHISHHWREIALALPALWNKTVIDLKIKPKPSYIQAITNLMERSGTSPTLNCHIISCNDWESIRVNPRSPIIKAVVRHSESLKSLNMCFDMHIAALFQGLKGHLPNLRNLCLKLPLIDSNGRGNIDIFETAPALRRVELLGSYPDDSIRLLLPWSQITHFYDTICSESVAPYIPLSFLLSLSYLYIDKDFSQASGLWMLASAFQDPSTLLPHYEPVTLSSLHTLKIHCHLNGDTGIFLDSLTIPAIEVIKISLPGSLVPHLVSMFSRSHEPSRLQKLAFRSIPLEEGELSALLNLVPQLIELDISVPPMADILRLIDCEGDDILVPMLRALYMHHMDSPLSEWMECFNKLAQVRCELGFQDSKDANKSSLATRNRLDMLRIIFNSVRNRHMSQVLLNDWYYAPEEDEAVDMFFDWSVRLCTDIFKDGERYIPNREHSYLGMLDELFTCIERCETITINVLHVGNSSLQMVYMKLYAHIIIFFLPFR